MRGLKRSRAPSGVNGPPFETQFQTGNLRAGGLNQGMPRKQKPPGMENWTWDEIRMGQKMSRGQKKARRLVKSLGGETDENGNIRIPEGEGYAANRALAFLLLLFMIATAVFAPDGCAR